MEEVPFFPPAEAVTVALPAAMPVTTPVPLTDTLDGVDDVQLNDTPGTGLPRLSTAVAVNCRSSFTATLADDGATKTR